MKTSIFKMMALAVTGFAFAACSDVDIPSPDTQAYPSVSNLTMTQEGRNVTLAWTLPQAENLLGVRIDKNGTLLANVDAPATSYVARHIDKNTDVFFTVKTRYADGVQAEGQTVMARYDGDVTPPAPADMAAGGVTPDKYGEIWVQVDRVGIAQGWQSLPAELVAPEVIAALADYVKNGGNLLLTKHATQLVAAIGRVSENRAPNLFSSGEGGVGTDTWTANAIIGSSQTEPYDHTGHQIYAGMEVATSEQTGFGDDTYGMEGPGFREDHNCMWDLNVAALEISTTPNVVKGFEEATNSTVLATWGHVLDYCCAGIVDFNPDGDYLGRVLAIGLNAYEWRQNDTENVYQDNIELLPKNCLDYLKQ